MEETQEHAIKSKWVNSTPESKKEYMKWTHPVFICLKLTIETLE